MFNKSSVRTLIFFGVSISTLILLVTASLKWTTYLDGGNSELFHRWSLYFCSVFLSEAYVIIESAVILIKDVPFIRKLSTYSIRPAAVTALVRTKLVRVCHISFLIASENSFIRLTYTYLYIHIWIPGHIDIVRNCKSEKNV